MPGESVFLDRTAHLNNMQQTRFQMQQDIDNINNELNKVMQQTQPLLEKQKTLQSQVALLDAQHDDNATRSESIRRLATVDKEAAQKLSDSPNTSPLRRPRTAQDNSPTLRNRSSGQNFSTSARRLRQLPTAARHHDIDLATEIGEGLVEEVRKLQSQLHEKDELLKDVTRNRVKQERSSDQIESRLKSMLADEEKLKNVNWELELSLQQKEETQAEMSETITRLESDLARHVSNATKHEDELDNLQEIRQSLEAQVAALKSSHSLTLANQKDVQNDLRGEIATLLRRLDNARADLETQKYAALRRPDLSSPVKNETREPESEEELVTPPGSPPLSPIKGTPHRNATLESETLKGTLFHNQTKMLRQRKDLEREKSQRLQLQKQVKDLEDEIASLRQTYSKQLTDRRKRKAEDMTRSKGRLHSKDVFGHGRRPTSEISSVDDAEDFWVAENSDSDRSAIETIRGSIRSRASSVEYAQQNSVSRHILDDESFGKISQRPRLNSTSTTSVFDAASDSEAGDCAIKSCAISPHYTQGQLRSNEQLRSTVFDTPVALQTELKGLSECNTPSSSVDKVYDLPVSTCDASVMTEEPWPILTVLSSAIPAKEHIQMQPDLEFILEDPANFFDLSVDEMQLESDLSRELETGQPEATSVVSPIEGAQPEISVGSSITSAHTPEAAHPCPSKQEGAGKGLKPEEVTRHIPCVLQSRSGTVVTNELQEQSGEDVAPCSNAESNFDAVKVEPTIQMNKEGLVSLKADSENNKTSSDCNESLIEPHVLLIGARSTKRATWLEHGRGTSHPSTGDVLQDIELPHVALPEGIETSLQSGDDIIVEPTAKSHSSGHDEHCQISDITSVTISKERLAELHKNEYDLFATRAAIEQLTREKLDLISKLVTTTTEASPRTPEQETKSQEQDQVVVVDALEVGSHESRAALLSQDTSYVSQVPSGNDSALESDSDIPSPERIRQLRTQRYMHMSPTAKADRLLGKEDTEARIITSSKSISRSLRSQSSYEQLQKNNDFGMAPPLAPSTAKDTIRTREHKSRTIAFDGENQAERVRGLTHGPSLRSSYVPPTRSYSQRSITSISSFASEIDERFNTAAQAPEVHTLADNPTDPATIESITRTMIGMSMYKYTRRAGRQGLSDNRHKRYFWIHPYTKTLYWSVYNPVNAPEGAIIKSAPILTVHVVDDFNTSPPGLHQRSICISTPKRTLKLTAIQSVDHEDWVRALNFLLYGHPAPEQSVEEAMETDAIIRDFSPSKTTRSPSRSSSSRAKSASTNRMFSSHSTVRADNLPERSLSKKLSSYFSKSSESKIENFDLVSGAAWKGSISVRGSTSFQEGLTLDSIADGPGLENVRSCCGGRHDVAELCRRPGTSRSSSRTRA